MDYTRLGLRIYTVVSENSPLVSWTFRKAGFHLLANNKC